jgi:hypothetical protein
MVSLMTATMRSRSAPATAIERFGSHGHLADHASAAEKRGLNLSLDRPMIVSVTGFFFCARGVSHET